MIEAAVRAPDHGNLKPWRFICIQGEARRNLGDVFAAAFARRHEAATAEDQERERAKPLRAPMVIAAAAAITHDHPSVRIIDQQLSAGAATMNLLNAAYLLGYGAIWLTGESCHDPDVKAALGLEPSDFIAGWIYVGTRQGPPQPRDRVAATEVLAAWQKPKISPFH